MARVLVSFSSHTYAHGAFQISCFYEGFINALQSCGNKVLCINSAEFLIHSWNGKNNNIPTFFNKQLMIKKVKEFNPEVVFAFNHSIPTEVEEACECPIVLQDADSLIFFNDKDYIRSRLGRYKFFGFSHESLIDAKKFGFQDNQIHFLRMATAIEKDPMEKIHNISFIGTLFETSGDFREILTLKDLHTIRDFVLTLDGKFYDDFEQILKQNNMMYLKDEVPKELLLSLVGNQKRVVTLANLSDLGLSLWGTTNWIDLYKYLPVLSMAYHNTRVYSLKHNQDIYNSSVLSVSIAHSQAIWGFPYRVMDIMASNACLVSDYHQGLEDLTKGYVDIPMFDNPYDARNLCQKLLKDDKWREDVIAGSQRCIEEKCRWSHRFKEMEQILGVTLVKEAEKAQEPVIPIITLKKEQYVYKSYYYMKATLSFISMLLPDFFVRYCYKRLKGVGIRFDQSVIADIKQKKKYRFTLFRKSGKKHAKR